MEKANRFRFFLDSKLKQAILGALVAIVFYAVYVYRFQAPTCWTLVYGSEPNWTRFRIDYNSISNTSDDNKKDEIYDKTLLALFPQSIATLDDNLRHQKLIYQNKSNSVKKSVQEAKHLLWLEIFYMPQVSCPTQVRLGTVGDGGYSICNPWLLAKSTDSCLLYSLGLNNDVLFEREFHDITGRRCDIYCLDENSKNNHVCLPLFAKGLISKKTDVENGRHSILDITRELGHKKIDVLKMDIKGAELSALPIFLRNFNGTVCQILLVLHANRASDAKIWLNFFQMIERRGFRLYNREPCILSIRCFQYSYIHLSCFEQYGLNPGSVLFRYFE